MLSQLAALTSIPELLASSVGALLDVVGTVRVPVKLASIFAAPLFILWPEPPILLSIIHDPSCPNPQVAQLSSGMDTSISGHIVAKLIGVHSLLANIESVFRVIRFEVKSAKAAVIEITFEQPFTLGQIEYVFRFLARPFLQAKRIEE